MKSSIEIPGANITRLRDAKSLKQEELGGKIGHSRQTVNAWEGKEIVKLSETKAQKLAKALGVTLADLSNKDKSSRDKPEQPPGRAGGYVPEHVLDHYRNTAEHIMNENKELWALLKDLRTKNRSS